MFALSKIYKIKTLKNYYTLYVCVHTLIVLYLLLFLKFNLLAFLYACLFYMEKREGMELGRRGGRESGRILGRGYHDQNILYERIYLQ